MDFYRKAAGAQLSTSKTKEPLKIILRQNVSNKILWVFSQLLQHNIAK